MDYQNYLYNNYMIPAVYDNNNLLSVDEAFFAGNIKKDSYMPYKNMTYIKPSITNEKEKRLYDIQKLCFYCHDLNLYLDIDPNNKYYIELYKKYNEEEKKLELEYERLYGPINLSNVNDINKWQWINNPWPWNK